MKLIHNPRSWLLALIACASCVELTDDPMTDLEVTQDPEIETTSELATTIAYRSSTTASAKTVTSLAIARPAGVVSGDVLIARIANRNQVTATLTVPTGWRVLRSDQSASQLKSWVAWKAAGSAEPTSYTFGVSIASYVAGSISAFSGVDPTNPIDASGGQKNGTTATFAAPALTTTVANGMAVWLGTQIWTGAACPASPIVVPTGFTEPFDTCLLSSSQGLLFDAAYKPLAAAGLQPAWNGSSPFPNTNTAQVIALRPAGAPTCTVGNTFSTTVTPVGNLTSSLIVEVSGLAASRVHPGVLYAHSENNSNFVAIDKTNAQIVGNYAAAIMPWDWEDIATGPGPAGSCIYMGEIGRASGREGPPPSTFAVYRMKEPALVNGSPLTVTGDRFPFQYPDTPANAETLMVHPTTGDIYVVTKEGTTGLSRVYKFPKPLPAPGTMSTLIHVANLQLPLGANTNFRSATAGTIHPCSNRFLIRTYSAVYEFRGPTGGTFESAFAATPVSLTSPVEGQGESIEYETNGAGFFTMSEREFSPYPLSRVARQ
ncbi:MAG: hypothetical protein WKG01_08010 [Kofleriaceae bacterium]